MEAGVSKPRKLKAPPAPNLNAAEQRFGDHLLREQQRRRRRQRRAARAAEEPPEEPGEGEE